MKRITDAPSRKISWRGIPVGMARPERKEYVVKEGVKSHYHVVINSNKSDGKMSPDDRAVFIEKFRECLTRLKDDLNAGRHIKFGNGKITNFQFNLEVGKIVNRLHFDGLISFDSFTLLDLYSIRKELKECLGPVYFFVTVIPDSIQQAKNYSEKDKIKIL